MFSRSLFNNSWQGVVTSWLPSLTVLKVKYTEPDSSTGRVTILYEKLEFFSSNYSYVLVKCQGTQTEPVAGIAQKKLLTIK